MNSRWVKRGVIALFIIAGVGWLGWQLTSEQNVIRLHGNTYHMTVMRSEAELERGLSGTSSLAADQAMVFVFSQNDHPVMWMKDMKYPIDMVWLNNEGKVVHLVKNAQPSGYPKEKFQSDVPAHYVIELPSGTIERTGITQGDPAGLPSGV